MVTENRLVVAWGEDGEWGLIYDQGKEIFWAEGKGLYLEYGDGCVLISRFSYVRVFVTLQTVARPLCPRDCPGKNTGVGCRALLQGNLPDPGIEPESLLHLLHWQVGSIPLPPPGKPMVMVTRMYIFVKTFGLVLLNINKTSMKLT